MEPDRTDSSPSTVAGNYKRNHYAIYFVPAVWDNAKPSVMDPIAEFFTVTDKLLLRIAIMWQDTLLSLTFGRPPVSQLHDLEESLDDAQDTDQGLSYRQAMSRLSYLWLRWRSSETVNSSLSNALQVLRELDQLSAATGPHLLNSESCTTTQQLTEHYAFQLHTNFTRATICRPHIVSSTGSRPEEGGKSSIFNCFRHSLKESAGAYAQLLSIAPCAARSWAIAYNGLASILLLSLMRETRYDAEVRLLQDSLISCLSNDQDELELLAGSGTVVELSEMHKRVLAALKALRRLTDEDMGSYGDAQHESPSSSTRDGRSERNSRSTTVDPSQGDGLGLGQQF